MMATCKWVPGGCALGFALLVSGGCGSGLDATGGAAAGGTGGLPPGSAGTAGRASANLVTNGDFSQGQTGWSVTDIGTVALGSYRVADGMICVALGVLQSFTLGWPADPAAGLVLSAGHSYTLTYQASSTTSSVTSLIVKVGHVVSPYTAAFQQTDAVAPSLATVTHTFQVTTTDDQAGIAFTVAGGSTVSDVCFDNVALVDNG